LCHSGKIKAEPASYTIINYFFFVYPEQKLRDIRLQQEKEEEKRLRAERSKTAFEQWKEKAKNRPIPMSLAIKDHKGWFMSCNFDFAKH
jgi:hypothetical protein